MYIYIYKVRKLRGRIGGENMNLYFGWVLIGSSLKEFDKGNKGLTGAANQMWVPSAGADESYRQKAFDSFGAAARRRAAAVTGESKKRGKKVCKSRRKTVRAAVRNGLNRSSRRDRTWGSVAACCRGDALVAQIIGERWGADDNKHMADAVTCAKSLRCGALNSKCDFVRSNIWKLSVGV